jgi:hypothetical protein
VPLFVVTHHNKIKRLTPETLYTYYVYKLNKGWNGGNRKYKGYFRQLLEDPLVPPEDKKVIEMLLNKPWNPYIRRHTALTEKAMQLPGAAFNQHGGWSVTSKMPRRYIHFFGGESSRAVLEAEGILKKKGEKEDKLKAKICTNCQTPNAPDAIWCVNETCRIALTLEGLQKMKEAQEREIESIVAKRLEEASSKTHIPTAQEIAAIVKQQMMEEMGLNRDGSMSFDSKEGWQKAKDLLLQAAKKAGAQRDQ